jgi:hypothetical protein
MSNPITPDSSPRTKNELLEYWQNKEKGIDSPSPSSSIENTGHHENGTQANSNPTAHPKKKVCLSRYNFLKVAYFAGIRNYTIILIVV